MKDITYKELTANPPKLERIKPLAREVIFTTVSCMCNNVHLLRMKKNSEGDFKLSGGMFSIENWQMKFKKHEIEWAADEGNWLDVKNMINSGTEKISKVISR